MAAIEMHRGGFTAPKINDPFGAGLWANGLCDTDTSVNDLANNCAKPSCPHITLPFRGSSGKC